MKNDDEPIRTEETLMKFYGGEDKVLTGTAEQWRGATIFSGPIQVDAAAEVEDDDKLRGGDGAQTCRCVAEKGGRREGKRGKWKEGCLTLFIRRRVTGGREKRGGQ